MNFQPCAAKTRNGMSSREVQACLGISVSARQFRRYVDAELFTKCWDEKQADGSSVSRPWIEKNANGHFVFYPPSNARWGEIRSRIEQWRELRYVRGWDNRPRVDKRFRPSDKTYAIVTIEGIAQSFSLWVRKMWPEVQEMDRDSLLKLHRLLEEQARLAWWIEREMGTGAAVVAAREKAFPAKRQR